MTRDYSTAPDTVKVILQKQEEFFASGATRGWNERKKVLTRLEKVLVDRRDNIIDALQRDLGKPDVEAFLAEYYFLLQELRLIRKSLKKWLKTRWVGSPFYFQPCSTAMRRDPFGSV